MNNRAFAQQQLNLEFVDGKITLEEWRRRFDELSDPHLWTADGPIKSQKPKTNNEQIPDQCGPSARGEEVS